MLKLLKSLFQSGPEPDYATLKREGAVVVDVRTTREFASGHIQGSVNIPVENIAASHKALSDKNKVVITCCASGMRSAAAVRALRARGFQHVHNGGSWTSLQRKF